MEKQYFTAEEVVQGIIEVLEDFTSYYCELHNEVANTGYYIVGTYEAKQALEQYGVFHAINEIVEYEKDNFGEVLTDFTDHEKIANILYYIKSEEVFYNEIEFYCILDEAIEDLELDTNDLWSEEATPEVNQYISNKLEGWLLERGVK